MHRAPARAQVAAHASCDCRDITRTFRSSACSRSTRPSRRTALLAAASIALLAALPLRAQETPVKFQLDWRFEGPAALFLVPAAKGYFKAEKLNVTIDAGNGSGGTVTRVASGTYDMGFADLAALMEFHANNPTAPNKPVAVMMVYNNTPAAVLALKKSGIKTPADLTGKKLGAPVFDAGRRAWPIFAKANGVERRGLDRDGPAAARDHAGARRHRRDHRLLVHLAAQPRGARREGRRHRRAALLAVRREAVRQRDHRRRGLPQEEPGGGEGLPARLHQGREGRDRRPEGGDRPP